MTTKIGAGTDEHIRIGVGDELRCEPRLRDQRVEVQVENGAVTITGRVTSFAARRAAASAAWRVRGVRAVTEALHVELPAEDVRADEEIEWMVRESLRRNVLVPEGRISCRVQEGWVTLTGSVWAHFQEAAALDAVTPLRGVRNVHCLIRIRPRVPAAEPVSEIRAALERQPGLDARGIRVVALDGEVYLSGTARSHAERQRAARAAWAAPGVERVFDRIRVVD